MFAKLLHLSKSESFSLSCSRSNDLREAVGNLLTVTMYLQDTLSRFHRPGLHKVDLRVHVASASTRTLAFQRRAAEVSYTAQSSQVSIFTTCSIGLSLRYPRKIHQPVPSARIHQNSNKPCSASLEDAYTGYHVFSTEPLTQNCNSRIAATVFDVSSPISIGHHHDSTLPECPHTRNIKIANQRSCCMQGFPIKYFSKRLMLISSRVVAVPHE